MQLLPVAANHYSLEPEGQFEVRPGRSEQEQVQTLPGLSLVAGSRDPLAVTPLLTTGPVAWGSWTTPAGWALEGTSDRGSW